MNFDENEELVLMDIDTSLTQEIPQDYWNSNHIVFDAFEYPRSEEHTSELQSH